MYHHFGWLFENKIVLRVYLMYLMYHILMAYFENVTDSFVLDKTITFFAMEHYAFFSIQWKRILCGKVPFLLNSFSEEFEHFFISLTFIITVISEFDQIS